MGKRYSGQRGATSSHLGGLPDGAAWRLACKIVIIALRMMPALYWNPSDLRLTSVKPADDAAFSSQRHQASALKAQSAAKVRRTIAALPALQRGAPHRLRTLLRALLIRRLHVKRDNQIHSGGPARFASIVVLRRSLSFPRQIHENPSSECQR